MSGRSILAAACLGWWLSAAGFAGQAAPDADAVAAIVARFQQAIAAGDAGAIVGTLDPSNDRAAAGAFVRALARGGVTRAVLVERDREPLTETAGREGCRVLVEAFVEYGDEALLSTISLDLHRPAGSGDPGGWLVTDQKVVSNLPELRRLVLNTARQYDVAGLELTAEDLSLRVKTGAAFTADTPSGPTALVLVGDGQLRFHPDPPAERDQLRIFAGQDTLDVPFTAALVRVHPASLSSFVTSGRLVERSGGADPRTVDRAASVFRADMPQSFVLDLGALSAGTWSLMPSPSDFLAEIHTRRLGALTYLQTENDDEDVNFFDRQRRKNIALYTSRSARDRRIRLPERADGMAFRVRHYDISASFAPDRLWLQATARLSIEIGSEPRNTLLLRLADSLAVRAVVSHEHGRLLAVRLRGQHTLVVNLPEAAKPGSSLDLSVSYAGRLDPQPIDREALAVAPQVLRPSQDPLLGPSEVPIERSFLFSSRSRWYPQPSAGSFATAAMKLTVPPGYTSAASGAPLPERTPATHVESGPTTASFDVTRPVRYLSWLVSRLEPVGETTAGPVAGATPGSTAASGVRISVSANPRLTSGSRVLIGRTKSILEYYGSLVGDFPYPTLACALVEGRLPAGHSPAHLTVISQPVEGSRLHLREDPGAFPAFHDFFLAHELAHQWWGQAVGWRTYRDQWLSEGFAQYFATLYAEHAAGEETAVRIRRYFQRWALKRSDRGPIQLGYRVGHLDDDQQSFRAVVYDKSAAVLHMLRRLIGDDAFFRAVRRFYATYRFRTAGTEDLRASFEAESGTSLGRFFERWVYGSALPRVAFSWRREAGGAGGTGPEVVIRFEQSGDVFDMPVTATLVYADGRTSDLVVALHERVTEARVRLAGRLARVEVNRDGLAVAEIR